MTTPISFEIDTLGGIFTNYKPADVLIEGFSADYVIADKGYDADLFINGD